MVSPLLGLLGTILGMVTVFRTIAENSAPNAAQLAAGIWEALIPPRSWACASPSHAHVLLLPDAPNSRASTSRPWNTATVRWNCAAARSGKPGPKNPENVPCMISTRMPASI